MASYKVAWIRPTVYIDNAGQAVTGFKVRIIMKPWDEARDLELPDDTAELIVKAAETAVKKRVAVDELGEVEVKIKK